MNWSDIEKPVRSLVKQLLQPTLKRALDTRDSVDTHRKILQSNNHRMNELENQVKLLLSKLVSVQQYSTKLIEFAASQKMMETRFQRDRTKFSCQAQELTEDFNSIKMTIDELQQQREKIRGEVGKSFFELAQLKGFLEKRICKAEQKTLQSQIVIQDQMKGQENRFQEINLKISSMKDLLSEQELATKKTENACMSNRKDLKRVAKALRDQSRESSNVIENNRLYLVKNLALYQERVSQIQNYTRNDLPVKLRVQILDILQKVSPPHLQKKLAQIQIENLNEISDCLDPEIARIVSEAKLQSQKYLSAPERSQTLLRKSTTKIISESENQQVLQSRHLSSEDSEVFFPEEVVKEMASSISEITEKINQIQKKILTQKQSNIMLVTATKSALLDVISQNKEDFSHTLQTLRSKLAKKLAKIQNTNQNQHIWLTSHEAFIQEADNRFKNFKNLSSNQFDQLKVIINNFSFQLQSLYSQRLRDNSDYQTQFKQIHQSIQLNINKIEHLDSKAHQNHLQNENISKILHIKLALDIQDQKDRDSIALVGKSPNRFSTPNKPRQIISLDKQCISCSNQKSMTMSAFKMACLAYTPSSVPYGNSLYTRRDLLEIQNEIIEKVFEQQPQEIDVSRILESVKRPRSSAASSRIKKRRLPVSYSTLSPDITIDDIPRLQHRPLSSSIMQIQ